MSIAINLNGKIHSVTEVTLKPKEIGFDKDGKTTKYVDKDGKQVKKLQVQASEYKWVYEDGMEYTGSKSYKCIEGKPVKEFTKTVTISTVKEIDQADIVYFIQNEHTYMLVGDSFKTEIKACSGLKKAVTFKYAIRGFKAYNAVVSYDAQLDRVFMRLYRGDLRKANLVEDDSVSEIESADDVKKIDIDDLEV